MTIKVQSPTRVDFAGGTLDVWPLFALIDHCVTLNISIDISTHVELTPLGSSQVQVLIEDLSYNKTFASLNEFSFVKDNMLSLIQAVSRYFSVSTGFHIRTRSDSPLGGGLGASSSLCISLIKAFSQWTHRQFTMAQAVELAHNLEAKILFKPTGTQDYVPAWKPGCYALEYGPQGLHAQTLSIDMDQIGQRMSLVYTGQPHHSGFNNWQVVKKALDGDVATMTALCQLRDVALRTRQALERHQWSELGHCFREEMRARLQLSEAFSSPEILRLATIAEQAGARAVKICGAGGGGCVIVWSEPDQKQIIAQTMDRQGFRVLSARPIA